MELLSAVLSTEEAFHTASRPDTECSIRGSRDMIFLCHVFRPVSAGQWNILRLLKTPADQRKAIAAKRIGECDEEIKGDMASRRSGD